MPVTIDRFVKKVDSLKEFIIQEVNRIMLKLGPQIEEMQRKRLSEGKNIKDKTIQKGYSEGYARRRKKKGLQTNYVDLNFTGEFYRSLDMVAEADFGKFDIISDVDYARYIFARFPQISGLSQKDAKTIKNLIIKELQQSVRKYLVA